MRAMSIGTMVRQKLYDVHTTEEPVYRYGLIVKEITDLPTKGNDKFYKVLWQPTDAYAVSRNRSYTDVARSDNLQLVSEVSRSQKENENGQR